MADFLVCLACRKGWWDVVAYLSGDFAPDFELLARSEGNALRGRLIAFHDPALEEAERLMERSLASNDRWIEYLENRTSIESLLRVVAWEAVLDPAPDGTAWVLGALPACRYCDSRQVIVAGADRHHRPVPRRELMYEITTREWSHLSAADQEAGVAAIIDATLDAVLERGLPTRLSAPRWLHNYGRQEPFLPIAWHPSPHAPRRPN
jgi:hypothetical protein